MKAGPRRVYVYYKVNVADLALVVDAARTLQAQLRQRWPGLEAELLRRPAPDQAGRLTLMEVYARDPAAGALDDAALAGIEAAASSALATWIQGARHAEVFEPCA